MSIQGITKSRLFWPLVALFLLVMVNFWFNPDFFSIRIVKGGLYGSVIDIINRAAPVMLIAMGMTLVIATRGIDISVGATVAISGAIAAALIGGSLEIKDGVQTYVSQTPMALAILAALGVGLLCGLWNGFLVAGIGMQPIIATLILMVAGRGIAQLITGGQIVTIYYEPFFFFGNGFFLGIPFAIYLVVAVAAVLLLLWQIGLSFADKSLANRFALIETQKPLVAAVQAGTPRDWLHDSAVACEVQFEWAKPDERLGQDFLNKALPLVEHQIRNAGYRLAAVLNELFD